MTVRSFLSDDDLGLEEQRAVLDAALEAKRSADRWRRRLEGKQVALIFEKPSTRTRVSFEVAVSSMGGHAVVLRGDELQLGRGETIEDTGRALSRYVDAIAVRTFEQDRLTKLAAGATVPVVNALSDDYHPCQALADLMTIEEKKGKLEGVSLAYIGDGNNVAHSLLIAGAMAGLHVRIATPEGFEPDPAVVQKATEIAADESRIGHTREVREAALGADVLYTDVWASMGAEDEADARRAAFEKYRIDEDTLELAAADAIVMHCLPAHRGEEISAALLDGDRSVVWDQAENRLHTQKALLAFLLA
jgi:ornithine carbamoyltransferase